MRSKIFLFVFLVGLCSCSGNSKRRIDGPGAGKEKFDPGIDTNTIVNRETMLSAARQLKSVIEREENQKDDPSYKKKYYRILAYKAILTKRMAAIMDTVPGNERAAFLKQYREILP